MDTSEQYIKMCDCPEIQGLKPRGNEFTISYKNPDIWIEHEGSFLYAKHDVWLPRQDQVQKIYREYLAQEMGSKRSHDEWFPKGDIGLGYAFNGFIKFASDYMRQIYNSFEQLWLAFYMYEKHGKTWDGKKWIK